MTTMDDNRLTLDKITSDLTHHIRINKGFLIWMGFLTVSLLFIPCAATVAVIRQETGSWRWTLLNIAFMLVVSVGAGALVYHIAAALVR